MRRAKLGILALAAVVGLAGCADDPVTPEDRAGIDGPDVSFARTATDRPQLTPLGTSIDEVNDKLAEKGLNIAIARAEYVLGPNASAEWAQEDPNHVIFANNRQLRLSSRWVPGDERRDASGDEITWINTAPFMIANFGTSNEIDASPPVDASFRTWNDVTCSNLELTKRADIQTIQSAILGGDPFVADVVTTGFLPGVLFDIFLGPGASQNVLGVTFTFIFGTNNPDGTFTPSDVNNDGRNDTALKEVWYNDAFGWTTSPSTEPNATDIETVALHENGHALELGHFGKIHATFNNGQGNDRPGWLHVSPRSVMNAIILGTLRSPLGTDNSSYCGNFADWPS